MISGFISNCLPHMKYYGDPINLPSLHVFGEADDIIPTGNNISHILFLEMLKYIVLL